MFRQVLSTDTEVRGASHMAVGYDHVNLGSLLHARRANSADAEKESRDALRIYAATLPPDHQYVASAQTGLARALMELGRLDDATIAATRALTIWRRLGAGGSSPDRQRAGDRRERSSQRGDDAKAEPMLAASYDRLRAHTGLRIRAPELHALRSPRFPPHGSASSPALRCTCARHATPFQRRRPRRIDVGDV